MSIRCLRLLAVVSLLAACASPAPIELRDMGSFHLGGREVVLSGKPVREVVFTPGGLPSTLDPNGAYQLEQMYVQYFLPARERGRAPLLLWHGGGLTGVTYETTPDGRPGWAPYPDIFSAEPILLTKAAPSSASASARARAPIAETSP